MQETLTKWAKDLRKFIPAPAVVFKINSSNLDDRIKVEAFLKPLANIKGPCIYRILIPQTKYCSIIKERFDSFQLDNKPKEKGVKRHVSRFMQKESEYLYVGSKRKNIEQRIKQHLGYGTARTYSMDLKYWFPPKIDMLIEVYSVKLDNELLVALEQKLWENSRPMFGKQSGL